MSLRHAGDDDLRGADGAGGDDRHHAHMAGSLDEHDVVLADRGHPGDGTAQRFEHRELLGGAILAEAVHHRPGQQLQVFGKAAMEARALVDRKVVAVDPVAVRSDDDVAHGDAVTLVHTPLLGSRGVDLLDAPDDLVTGNRGKLAAPRGVDVALEVVDVAVAEARRLHPHHRAPGLGVGDGKVAHLPRLVAVEHDCAAHGRTSSRMAVARSTARRSAGA